MANRVTELLNAFRPDSEIEDPDLFSGRQAQILDLTHSLHSAGSCPMILGDRGLGKSSLAKQVRLIAMGDTTLLARADSLDAAIPQGDEFIALYLGCTDSVETTGDLLRRLGTGVRNVVTASDNRRDFTLTERTTKAAVSLKVFSFERAKKWAPQTWISDPDPEQELINVTTRLSDIYEARVLLIIDELDRVNDKTGLASFIKSATTRTLKFMLVGIAQNVSDLLGDHQSVERIIAPTHVPTMTDPELRAIVTRATDRLKTRNIEMTFEPASAGSLSYLAGGFPWFVHVLGQAALIEADRAKAKVVDTKHVAQAVKHLTRSRFAQQFSDAYQQAVRDSPNREIALRSFAMWRHRDIPTADVYRFIKDLGVANPSEYRRQLSTAEMGSVLVTSSRNSRG